MNPIVTVQRQQTCCMCGREIRPGEKAIAYAPEKDPEGIWVRPFECASCADIPAEN